MYHQKTLDENQKLVNLFDEKHRFLSHNIKVDENGNYTMYAQVADCLKYGDKVYQNVLDRMEIQLGIKK